MSLCHGVIAGMWLLFIAYWAVAAVGAKRSATEPRWFREIGLRLVVILLIAAAPRAQLGPAHAMLGSAIGVNVSWVLLLVPVGASRLLG